MSDVTRLLDAAAAGDRQAAADLLPLVYAELRALAAARMAAEPAGHTLQPTALVHEAYLRLVGPADVPRWDTRGHFFAAAAEAMRRILIDAARRKRAAAHGGGAAKTPLPPGGPAAAADDPTPWLDLDDALTRFQELDPQAADLAKLRLFGGLSVEEAGAALGVARATAFRQWKYARAWLGAALGPAGGKSDPT